MGKPKLKENHLTNRPSRRNCIQFHAMKLLPCLLLAAIAITIPSCGAKKNPVAPGPNAAMEKFAAELNGSDPEAHLRVLTEALQAYMMTKNMLPKELSELVSSGLIPKLPAPPTGQKFEIDKAAAAVVLVAQ